MSRYELYRPVSPASVHSDCSLAFRTLDVMGAGLYPWMCACDEMKAACEFSSGFVRILECIGLLTSGVERTECEAVACLLPIFLPMSLAFCMCVWYIRQITLDYDGKPLMVAHSMRLRDGFPTMRRKLRMLSAALPIWYSVVR